MAAGTQAVFLFIALVSFVVAAVLAITPRSWWNFLVAVGLAAWVFVPFWIAVKAH